MFRGLLEAVRWASKGVRKAPLMRLADEMRRAEMGHRSMVARDVLYVLRALKEQPLAVEDREPFCELLKESITRLNEMDQVASVVQSAISSCARMDEFQASIEIGEWAIENKTVDKRVLGAVSGAAVICSGREPNFLDRFLQISKKMEPIVGEGMDEKAEAGWLIAYSRAKEYEKFLDQCVHMLDKGLSIHQRAWIDVLLLADQYPLETKAIYEKGKEMDETVETMIEEEMRSYVLQDAFRKESVVDMEKCVKVASDWEIALSDSSIRKVIHIYCKGGDVESALAFLHAHPISVPRVLSSAIHVILGRLSKQGQAYRMEEVLGKDMVALGVTPNRLTYELMARTYGKMGDEKEKEKYDQLYEKAEEALERKEKGERIPIRDQRHAKYVGVGAERAMEMVMEGQRVGANIHEGLFLPVMEAYAREGEYDEMVKLHALLKKNRVILGTRSMNKLLSACSRGKESWHLFKVFNELVESGFSPSHVSHAILLKKLKREDKMEEMERWFQERVIGGGEIKLNFDICQPLLDVYVHKKRDHEKVKAFLEGMKKEYGIQVPKDVVRTLENTYARRNWKWQWEELLPCLD